MTSNLEKPYWDSLAREYEDEILNVFAHDEDGLIASLLDAYLEDGADVADFGCGIGLGIPLLASKAGTVYAVDLSTELLERAQHKWRRFKNVRYVRCDLTRESPAIPKVQCILSTNVLISPRHETREQILRSMKRSLKPGGVLLLLVPSLESQLWVYNRLVARASARTGNRTRALRAAKSEVSRELRSAAEGTIRLSGTDTKFFWPGARLFSGYERLRPYGTTHGRVLVERRASTQKRPQIRAPLALARGGKKTSTVESPSVRTDTIEYITDCKPTHLRIWIELVAAHFLAGAVFRL